MKNKKYLRNCPICSKELFYSKERSRDGADKINSVCASCASSRGKEVDRTLYGTGRKIKIIKNEIPVRVVRIRSQAKKLWNELEDGLFDKLKIKKRRRSQKGIYTRRYGEDLVSRIKKVTGVSTHTARFVLRMFKSGDPLSKKKIFSDEWESIFILNEEFDNYMNKGVWERINKPEVVYFLQAELTKRIKIGHTRCFEKRMKEWNTSNSENIEILFFFEGNIECEQRLHKKFKKHLVKNKFEWFEPSQEILDYIEVKKNNE